MPNIYLITLTLLAGNNYYYRKNSFPHLPADVISLISFISNPLCAMNSVMFFYPQFALMFIC